MRIFSLEADAGRPMKFESDQEAIGTDLTDVAEIMLHGRAEEIALEIQNLSATLAVTDFAVLVKPHEMATYTSYLQGAEFDATTRVSMLWATATGPHECAAAGRAQARIVVGPMYSVKFQAKRAAGAGTHAVRVRGTVGAK